MIEEVFIMQLFLELQLIGRINFNTINELRITAAMILLQKGFMDWHQGSKFNFFLMGTLFTTVASS